MAENDESDTQRGRILDAALRVFARKGFKGASVREIASEAGVTTGAIYYHFADKDDLLAAAIKRDVHYVFSLSPYDEDGRPKSRDVFDNEIAAATACRLSDAEHQRLHQILAAEVITLDADERAKHRAAYEETIRKAEGYFSPALGTVDSEDAYFLASFLVAALDGMAIQTSLGVHADDMDRMTSTFNDFFSTSIKAYLERKDD